MVNNLYVMDNERYRLFLQQRLNILEKIGVKIHLADARDYDMLSRIMSAIKPDIVVHLAAIAHVSVSQKSPYTTFDHSLRTLENALDVSTELGVKKFVYFSSSTVYGDWTKAKMAEDDICEPIGIYGSLKLAGELMVKGYNHAKGLPYVIIRPSALYGPRCVSGRVLQTFIEQAMERKSLRASTESLDFTYIDDLVDGTVRAIEWTGENEIFNLTFGQSAPVIFAAKQIGDIFGVSVLPSNEEPIMNRGTLNIRKAGTLLGYKPGVPVSIGVKKYADWYSR